MANLSHGYRFGGHQRNAYTSRGDGLSEAWKSGGLRERSEHINKGRGWVGVV